MPVELDQRNSHHECCVRLCCLCRLSAHMQVTQTLTSDINRAALPGQVDTQAAGHPWPKICAAQPLRGNPLEQQRTLSKVSIKCPSLQVDHPEAAIHS